MAQKYHAACKNIRAEKCSLGIGNSGSEFDYCSIDCIKILEDKGETSLKFIWEMLNIPVRYRIERTFSPRQQTGERF